MSRTSTFVAGRRVVHARGSSTQTINICTPQNERGTYEEIHRLPIGVPVTLTEIAEMADLEALRTWLASRNADIEHRGAPSGRSRGARLPRRVDVSAAGADWLPGAVTAVERALDALVLEFVEHPYLHRVEHSLHAHLFRMLIDDPALAGTHQLATGQRTQLLHKEWPETVPGAPGSPRGLFDLAVLAPTQVGAATLLQFRTGRIDAPVVVEAGLDYGREHLVQDVDKLINSEVPAPYLLHLSRLAERDQDDIERILCSLPTPLRAAYAVVDPVTGAARFKLVGQDRIQVR